MTNRTFGALAAGAVVTLLGSAALAADAGSDAKACYRQHCGKSITGLCTHGFVVELVTSGLRPSVVKVLPLTVEPAERVRPEATW
jgi:hypothetical protein